MTYAVIMYVFKHDAGLSKKTSQLKNSLTLKTV